MNTQDTGAAGHAHQDSASRTRASDADRDQTADLINAAFAEGRMDADEHAERLDAAYTARTWDQLRRLTVDLPSTATHPAVRAQSSELEHCLQCALMIVCPPIGLYWWYRSRRGTPSLTGDTGDADAVRGANRRPALR